MFAYFKLLILNLSFVFAFIYPVFSQISADEELAKKLKKEYKDKEFVALETFSEIEVSLDKKTSQPIITDKQRLRLITLKDNAELIYNVAYDDNSEVDPNYVAKDSKNKNIFGTNKVCGNYEVSNIFYSDAKICTYIIPLGTFGSTNQFCVNIKNTDVKYFTKVFFHEAFPSESRIITFIIPAWMEVELMEINFAGFNVVKTKEVDDKLKVSRYTYKMSKLKAFDKENYTRGICHRYPHILVLSKSYSVNQQKKEILNSSNDLYKWYSGLVKTVENHSELLKDQVNTLINGKTTDEEKIKAIYYWVQDNIKYIAFEEGIAGFKPEGASNVYKNRYGDCKGMANLTKEMLKQAGFDARLTWIGTTNLPYSCQIPSLAINDHMICTVILKDKKYILDPTEKFIALSDHAERIQGKDIMIENGDAFIQDKVPVHGKERNLTRINASLEVDGSSLKGQAQMILRGESKKDLLYEADITSSKEKEKLLKYITTNGGDKGLTVEVLETTPFDQREGELKIDYTFKIDNYVNTFNNEMYIDMDPYKQYRRLSIDSTRLNDFNFSRKIFIKDIYKIKIPQGYKTKSMPKGMDKKNEEFSVKLSYRQENDEIIFEKEISIDKGIITKINFPIWNKMIGELVKNYNDQVVLIKNQ